MEFIRFTLHDYQQYIFMIFGVFVALSDMLRFKALKTRGAKKRAGRSRRAVIGVAIPSQS
jgi:hypothetical protein